MKRRRTYYKLVRKTRTGDLISAAVVDPRLHVTYRVGKVAQAPPQGLGLLFFEDYESLCEFCTDNCTLTDPRWYVLKVRPVGYVHRPKWVARVTRLYEGDRFSRKRLFQAVRRLHAYRRKFGCSDGLLNYVNLTHPPPGTLSCRKLLVLENLGPLKEIVR